MIETLQSNTEALTQRKRVYPTETNRFKPGEGSRLGQGNMIKALTTADPNYIEKAPLVTTPNISMWLEALGNAATSDQPVYYKVDSHGKLHVFVERIYPIEQTDRLSGVQQKQALIALIDTQLKLQNHQLSNSDPQITQVAFTKSEPKCLDFNILKAIPAIEKLHNLSKILQHRQQAAKLAENQDFRKVLGMYGSPKSRRHLKSRQCGEPYQQGSIQKK